ncbi:MAG TPA: oligopeptide/dipeptide ABC transporter ATP-binding protein [Hyphomicrobiales bacterium]|nr:oligopeptide/dipeptide ABC transporter ATP-binding protein [Hyphomicrobiales bacterium]
MTTPVLEVSGLKKHFPVRARLPGGARGVVRAVDDVAFSIGPGETLGVIGESGCGKTTMSRVVLAAIPPTSGSIRCDGEEIVGAGRRTLAAYRRKVQVVFQDPFSSLSPRMRVEEIIAEPILAHRRLGKAERRRRVAELLALVGLDPAAARRYPHEFSGGQRQRIAIARALSTDARLIVLDEPVSALDASIRAHVINLLRDLQARLGVAYLFIGHDLAVVANISHEIAVMYLGKIVEIGGRDALVETPLHPYTKALFAAALPSLPGEQREEVAPDGEVPSALDPPSGCHFHPRCPFAMPRCAEIAPVLAEHVPGHRVACHLYS